MNYIKGIWILGNNTRVNTRLDHVVILLSGGEHIEAYVNNENYQTLVKLFETLKGESG